MEERKRKTAKSKIDKGQEEERCWLIRGECFDESIEENYGFVYLITNLLNQKIYVGKKAFTHRAKKRLSKKVIKSTKTRKRIEITSKDSGWKNYFGSSKELLLDIEAIGKQHFKREIIDFAISKSDLSLKEIEWQVKMNVLRVPSYNNWIGGKVYKRYL